MTPERIFELATSEFGGRRYKEKDSFLEDHRNRANSFLDLYKKYPHLLKPFPSVHLDFVDSIEFNAFASKYDQTYLIGINCSVRYILFDLFNRMLAHPDILKEIGNSSEEVAPKDQMKDYYSSLELLINEGHLGNYNFIYPKNIERRIYADHLTTIAFDFVFEHEFSHVIFGHVDYLNQKYGLKIFSEFHKLSNEEEFNLDLQTLEMDADCTSLARCCNWAHEVFKKPSRIHNSRQKYYSDIHKALSDIFFAIFNVIKLFGDGDFKNTRIGKTSHPDPRIRQLMLVLTLNEIIKKYRTEITKTKFNDEIKFKLIESERAYQIITGTQINKEVYEDKYYWDHPLPNALKRNWETKLREELLPFSFKPLAK